MDDDALQDDPFETYPSLSAVARFSRLIPKTPWFRGLGDPLTADICEAARDYAHILGFPEIEPALITDWRDAAFTAESADWNSPAWEAEEQLRAHLITRIHEDMDKHTIELVQTYIGGIASDAATEGIREAVMYLQIDDEAFAQAAVGAAVQACHLAALVLAAEGTADHPFSLKYQLFESGRWPIGIAGSSFNIF